MNNPDKFHLIFRSGRIIMLCERSHSGAFGEIMKKLIFILLFISVTVSVYAKTLTIEPYKIYVYDAETKEPLKNVRVVSAINVSNSIPMLTDQISDNKYYLEEYYTDENGCVELPLRKYHRITLGYKYINEFLYINLQLSEKTDVDADFNRYEDFYFYGEVNNRVYRLYRLQQEYEAWCIDFLPLSEYASKYIKDRKVSGGIVSSRLYPEDGKLIIYLKKVSE